MSLLSQTLRFVDRLSKPVVVYAHCDVPCGIYDPVSAQIAAATVVKMVEKIQALPKDDMSEATRNSFVRMVWTKEEHARKCKEELLILWTDFFKPEHLAKHPQLHEMFWKAAKLCSKNKQEISMEAAKELQKAVEEVAKVFHEVKAAAKK